MSCRHLKLLFLWQAFAYAVFILTSTGIITEWGRWYSSNPHYRQQVEAFLRGELALSHNPVEAIHDLTWSCGGVHQVWGLGIPLWRLPFEAMARLSGQSSFPDHFTFGIALVLWAFVVLRAFLAVPRESDDSRCGLGFGRGLLSVILILLCPIFLSTCSARFQVYEEAVAYEFIFAIGLLAGLVRLWRRPTWRGCHWLCAIAGCGALIRPTLLFYGGATWIGALWIMTPEGRSPKWGRIAISTAVFAAGGGTLFVTNRARFGSGFEFGHRLNLQTLFGSVYATRFDHPFAHESLFPAIGELLGLLFRVGFLNGGDYYCERFFPGQSATVRWRELYFTTYDLSWLPLILGGWGLGLYAVGRSLRVQSPFRKSTPIAPQLTSTTLNRSTVPLPGIAAVWSIIPATLLCAFYLRNCVVSSRYLADLGPAFCAAIVALVWGWPVGNAETRCGGSAAVALLGWLGFQILTVRNCYGPPSALTVSEVEAHRVRPVLSPEAIGDRYALQNLTTQGAAAAAQAPYKQPWASIRYNGVGWNHYDGFTKPVVIAFVNDARFLELDVQIRPGATSTESDWQSIQAKIGLDLLTLESNTNLTNGTRRLRFAVSKPERYQPGLQVAFLAFGSPDHLSANLSPFRLLQIRWK